MFIALVLPPVIAWAGLGLPTDRASLGILLASALSGILVGVKELLGGSNAPTTEN